MKVSLTAIHFLRMPVHSWVALALAVTVHVFVVSALGPGSGKNILTGSGRFMRVSLISATPEKNLSEKIAASEPIKQVARNPIVRIAPKANTLPSAVDFPLAEIPIDELPLISIPAPPEPYYFHGSELSEKPKNTQDELPQITFTGIGDPPPSLILRLMINEMGEIDKVQIESEQVTGEMEQAIISFFAKMKFYPGKIEEVPVKSQVRIEVQMERVVRINKPRL